MRDLRLFFVLVYFGIFCGLFLVYTCLQFQAQLSRLKRHISIPFVKHLLYRPLFAGHYLGEWSRADMLGLLVYFAVTCVCLFLKSPDFTATGNRAADLFVVHMLPLCVTPQLDALTNVLGVAWRHVRRAHAAIGMMALGLLILHLATLKSVSLSSSIDEPQTRWGIIAATTIGALPIVSILRKRQYELFLRLHQGLVVVCLYGLWVHISPGAHSPRMILYFLLGTLIFSSLFHCTITLYRNGIFRWKLPYAVATHSDSAIFMTVELPQPLLVRPGQYVNVWLPASSMLAPLQTHPFIVASWSDGPIDHLELLIEPRKGLTRHLFHKSRRNSNIGRVLFTGPHGTSVPVGEYETVLMIASGFGVAAQLPYLRQLLHSFKKRTARTRRIHFLWELVTLDLPLAMQALLNEALEYDTLDDSYILQVSVYVEQVKEDERFGQRAEVIRGAPNWQNIFEEEASGKHIKRVEADNNITPTMMVTAATTAEVRKELRNIIEKYVSRGAKMVELDYQTDI